METEKEYLIKLEDGTRVPVTAEIYKEYYRPEWREHKCEQRDRKRLLSSDYQYDDNCTFEDFMADTKPGPGETALHNEISVFLGKALEVLTEDARALIQALIIDGKSERDYAKETNIARTTINYRREKALKQMRDYMEKHL